MHTCISAILERKFIINKLTFGKIRPQPNRQKGKVRKTEFVCFRVNYTGEWVNGQVIVVIIINVWKKSSPASSSTSSEQYGLPVHSTSPLV